MYFESVLLTRGLHGNSNEDESRNTFVELALVYSLGMMGHLIPMERMETTLDSGLEIVIAGNNDFYSQRKEVRSRPVLKMRLIRTQTNRRR